MLHSFSPAWFLSVNNMFGEYMVENMQENMVENMQENMVENMQENMVENMQENICGTFYYLMSLSSSLIAPVRQILTFTKLYNEYVTHVLSRNLCLK